MNQTQLILDIFEDFRMPPTLNDEYNTKGKPILIDKMDSMVEHSLPISFVMLGFPFKSTNQRDKVIGNIPDLGEQLTINNFKELGSRVKTVYAPGINMVIVSDGYVFNDLLKINDGIVQAYKEISMDMAKDSPMEFYDMNDFYSKKMSLVGKRDRVIEQFGISEAKLDSEILNNPDVNFLYRGMIHFMSEELSAHVFPSKSQLQNAAKKLTRKMMLRNEAYSNLVKNEFGGYIRLSMHPSINVEKFSIKLIRGNNTPYSAWHCAILDRDGTYSTVHKSDAEKMGAILQYKDGNPYNYISTTNQLKCAI